MQCRPARSRADKVRERALNVLRLLQRAPARSMIERPREERADDRPAHRALIRRAGAEGAVLLKNDGSCRSTCSGKIAVIGPNAKVAQIMGGGSAQLNPHYRVIAVGRAGLGARRRPADLRAGLHQSSVRAGC